jgi:hypothetical protein
MEPQDNITEPQTEPAPQGLAEDPAPAEGLADPAPNGEGDEGGEAGDPSGEGEAPEFFDLSDADLDSLPALKRKIGEEEKIYKLKELVEHYERFGTLKQVQDVQSLYRKLEQERPEIEKKAKAEFDQFREQVTPRLQAMEEYNHQLQTQPGEVALSILEKIVPPALFQNIKQALYTPQHEGGAGYNPQQYQTQFQAQQAPQYQQQAAQVHAQLEGERALLSVSRELKLDLSPEDEQKVRREAAMLWNAGVRNPVEAAKTAITRLQKLGELKAPKPAPVMAKQTLSQQIQKTLSKPKTGARQTGTGGMPQRQSRAIELSRQIDAANQG